MRIRDWSSDVCSSDLAPQKPDRAERTPPKREASPPAKKPSPAKSTGSDSRSTRDRPRGSRLGDDFLKGITDQASDSKSQTPRASSVSPQVLRSEEHTSELQSLMRTSYASSSLKQKIFSPNTTNMLHARGSKCLKLVTRLQLTKAS